MALIKCSECGKEISDKATSCPECGCLVEAKTSTKETNGKKGKLTLIAILAGVLIIALAIVVVITIKGKNEYKKLVGTWQMDVDISDKYEIVLSEFESMGIEVSDSIKNTSIPVYLQLDADKSYVIFVDEEEYNILSQKIATDYEDLLMQAIEAYISEFCAEYMISENKFEAYFVQVNGRTIDEYIAQGMKEITPPIYEPGDGILDCGTWSVNKGELYFSSVRDFDEEQDHSEYIVDGGNLTLTNGHGYVFELLSDESNTIYQFDNDMKLEFVVADKTRSNDDIALSDITEITESEAEAARKSWDEFLLNEIETAIVAVCYDPYIISNDEASDYLHYIEGESVDITAVTVEDNIIWHDVEKMLFGPDGVFYDSGNMSDLSNMIFSDGATGKIYFTIKNGSLINLEIDGTEITNR